MTPRQPIPVLFVVRELGLGGIERDVAKLALGIDRSRYLPHVATYRPEGPRYEELRAAGIPVLSLQFPSLLSPQCIRAAAQFSSFVEQHGIQLVHAFDPSSVFAVPLARALRVPVVLSSQLGHRELHDPRTRKQLGWVDRLSNTVVVNCQALQRHLTAGHQVPSGKIEVCYNGVDTAEFHPAPVTRLPELSGAELVIGTVGVLRPEKALDLLLSAFERIVQPGIKLAIVGNGPEHEKLQAQRDALGLKESCVFLPAVARVAPVMHSLDIFVSCSSSEAFSNALLEAMACGVCCVGSRVGGTPELLGQDERGLLFTSGDVHDLAAKLSALIASEPLRRRLACSAAAFAREHLNVSRNIERNMQIYDQLFERKGFLQ